MDSEARNVIGEFQQAIMDAGLPYQRFHDLRHACATLMIENRGGLAVVSKSLGHAHLSTTADIHADPDAGHAGTVGSPDGRDPLDRLRS